MTHLATGTSEAASREVAAAAGPGQVVGQVVVPLQGSGPGAGSPASRPEHRRRPLLLRWPTPPYLLLADVLVFSAVVLLHWPQPVQLTVLATIVFTFWMTGLYRSRLTMSILDDLPYLTLGVLAGLVMQLAVLGLSPDVEPGLPHVQRLVLLLVLLVLVRTAAYAVVRQARCSGRVRHTALVLGAGHVGMRLARTLQDHCELGLDPVGFVDSRPRVEEVSELAVSSARRLRRAPAPHPRQRGPRRHRGVRQRARAGARQRPAHLRPPAVRDLLRPAAVRDAATARDMDQAWGIPLVRLRRAPFRPLSLAAQAPARRHRRRPRAGPARAAAARGAALAVRLEGGPGVLFRQDARRPRRPGLHAPEVPLAAAGRRRRVRTNWNIAHDDRLGPVGRFLRRTSLDELPQLWNILRGDMSLVGPRPERPHFVDAVRAAVPRYMARHRVPAGLTGWAQVHGLRGDTSIADRARFDNYYIENWSLWGDVKIMVRTLDHVLRARGA